MPLKYARVHNQRKTTVSQAKKKTPTDDEHNIRNLCHKAIYDTAQSPIEHSVRLSRSIHRAEVKGDAVSLSKSNILPSNSASGGEGETELDRIVKTIKRDFWPDDVLLLITPSSRHANNYKLHVISQKSKEHLGMTGITRQELLKIKTSQILQMYSVVVGTKFVDLRTVATRTNIVSELVDTISSNCCIEKMQAIENEFGLKVLKSNTALRMDKCTQTTKEKSWTARIMLPIKNNLEPSVETQKQLRFGQQLVETIPPPPPLPVKKKSKLAVPTVIDRAEIQNMMMEFSALDRISDIQLLQMLLTIARFRCRFFLRPEISLSKPVSGGLYRIECFVRSMNYVGSVGVRGGQVQRILQLEPQLLPKVECIDEISVLAYIPIRLFHCVKQLCKWLHIEMFNDILAELTYYFMHTRDYLHLRF